MSGPAVQPTGSSLGGRLRALVDDALEAFAGHPDVDRLTELRGRLDEPLRVAVAGRLKAGKSTLLNAILGERVAATDATECTRVVTWYVHGHAPRAWAYPLDGERHQLAYLRTGGTTSVELGTLVPGDLDHLAIEVPNEQLQQLTVIDTPGMGSLTRHVSARTERFFATAGERGADAVLYLMRQVHSSDVGFLDAFQQDEFRGTSPVNAIGVLSRADELGAGRGDALELADHTAGMYRRDARIRRLVQTVVPVAGLLGQAGSVLTEQDFALLEDLVAQPASSLASAELFVTTSPVGTPPQRQALLDDLGLFGVRLSVDLIRRGLAPDSGALSSELRRRSGLDQLRRLLLDLFMHRADALKAQLGLQQLEAFLTANPGPAADRLRRRLEQLLVGAHEIAELRLLNDLRSGALVIDDADLLEAAEALLGSGGTSIDKRLRLPADAPVTELRPAVLAALRRWQQVASSPVSDADTRRLASVLRRTCEGMFAGLDAAAVRPSDA